MQENFHSFCQCFANVNYLFYGGNKVKLLPQVFAVLGRKRVSNGMRIDAPVA